MLHIKKGDKVKILSGDEKGKTGKVLEMFPKDNRAIVEGINMVSRHKKPRSAQEAGGITKTEAPIGLSKLQVVCPVCGTAARMGFVIEGDKKSRVCKKCGKAIDNKDIKQEKAKSKAKKEQAQDAVTEAPKSDAVEAVQEKPAAKKTTVKNTESKATEAPAKTVKKAESKATETPAKAVKKTTPKKEKTEPDKDKA